MDKIKIEKLTVFGKHGVYPEENVLGQKFEVSLVLYTDTRKAGLTDDLECSINYGDVCHYVKQFFEENRKCAIAFSGGVDSAYLLYAAVDAGAAAPGGRL